MDKEIEVWIEGYKISGAVEYANLVGTYHAKSFKDACYKAFKGDDYYNDVSNTYWGCRLYDNEYDAKRKFG